MELWKQIDGISGYSISNIGRIRRDSSLLILKTRVDRYGYEAINIGTGAKRKSTTVHRLVALAFVEGRTTESFQVNHKDGNKLNNHYSNLEWVTPKVNIDHSFQTGLNPNKYAVTMIDNASDTVQDFRSIKTLSNHLRIRTSTLMPLIKHSSVNQILGRYTVIINNLSTVANTDNFGRVVYVLDTIDGTVEEYPSVLICAYHTGIRSLASLGKRPVISTIGYVVSFDRELLVSPEVVDKCAILEKRDKYINTPYTPNSNVYKIYNYYSNQEISLESIEDCVDYLNRQEPLHRNISRMQVIYAISDGVQRKRTGIIKGYGIVSGKRPFDWEQWNEEVILRNKYGISTYEVFRVFLGGSEELIFGKYNLIQKLGYRSNKALSNISVEEIEAGCGLPNLKIIRLNKPIGC